MNRYKIILTAKQSSELINLILNRYSIVESIEYLTSSEKETDYFKVIGFWYSSNPSWDLAEYGTKYYYRDKDSKIFNKIYDFMKPLLRDFKIEELGL
jgi:abortive infection bacteriophage resistance protein